MKSNNISMALLSLGVIFGTMTSAQCMNAPQDGSRDMAKALATEMVVVGAEDGFFDTIEEGLRLGADINAQSPVTGMTAMHYAVMHAIRENNTKMIDFLLDRGANIDSTDDVKSTPIFLAVSQGSPILVEYLISKGANVDAKAYNDYTPLFAAAMMNRPDTATVLLAYHANIYARDKNGKTPYDHASDPKMREFFERQGLH